MFGPRLLDVFAGGFLLGRVFLTVTHERRPLWHRGTGDGNGSGRLLSLGQNQQLGVLQGTCSAY